MVCMDMNTYVHIFQVSREYNFLDYFHSGDGTHVTSLELHLRHVRPTVCLHVVLLHAAQLLRPIEPPHSHDLPVQDSSTHTGTGGVHGPQRGPCVGGGVVPLQGAEVIPFVVPTEDVDLSLERHGPDRAATVAHVRGGKPAVLGRIIPFHRIQEHARMAAPDGVQTVPDARDTGTVPSHVHAGNALPFPSLGAVPLG